MSRSGPFRPSFGGAIRTKRKRLTEEQIAFARRQAESGTPVREVCRKLLISEQPFDRWKKQFLGMGVAEVRRFEPLEEKNDIVEGEMTCGFAMFACPPESGDSGIMSFLVGPEGIVPEPDLGDDTSRMAAEITAHDPDERWSPIVE